jgi:hypothetical protein
MDLLQTSSLKIFIPLILSIAVVVGTLEIQSINYALGQPATEPGPTETPPPGATTEPGPTETPPPGATKLQNATETVLATTTTTTSTYSFTKGGLHISTTITNTTTVSPVQP